LSPTKDEHRAKAEHNEFLANELDNPFWDWAITGLFYSALHYVEAYLATKGIHFRRHKLRDSWIYRDAALKPIYIDYRELQTESEDARYMEIVPLTIFTQGDVQRLEVNLQAIKKVVIPLI
jgi:hypothetical protein